MVGTGIRKTDKMWCAAAYLPIVSLFIYLWGKKERRRFHGYQGIALSAYGVVALLIADIICEIVGFPAFPVLVIIAGLYFAVTVIAGILVLTGKEVDMKIHKSPEGGRS
jgi:hypothetical protein